MEEVGENRPLINLLVDEAIHLQVGEFQRREMKLKSSRNQRHKNFTLLPFESGLAPAGALGTCMVICDGVVFSPVCCVFH